MITIENDILSVTITEKGAEIQSVIDKQSGHEFIWQGDTKFWGRRSPVLFPIVGTLNQNKLNYKGKSYSMERHGFARDRTFTVQKVTTNAVTLNLQNTAETLKIYPFEFNFQVSYILFDNQVTVSYEILNPSTQEVLYYSVGGHPAFNVSHHKPEGSFEEFDKLFLRFKPSGQYYRIPLNDEGLIESHKAKYQAMDKVQLDHKMFRRDALIYQINQHTEIILEDKAADVTISIDPIRMSFMGIWSPYPNRAPFVCLEPWAGIADEAGFDGDFSEKYGINSLKPQAIKSHDYTISFVKGAS